MGIKVSLPLHREEVSAMLILPASDSFVLPGSL
jgi:hypothetical protein